MPSELHYVMHDMEICCQMLHLVPSLVFPNFKTCGLDQWFLLGWNFFWDQNKRGPKRFLFEKIHQIHHIFEVKTSIVHVNVNNHIYNLQIPCKCKSSTLICTPENFTLTSIGVIYIYLSNTLTWWHLNVLGV